MAICVSDAERCSLCYPSHNGACCEDDGCYPGLRENNKPKQPVDIEDGKSSPWQQCPCNGNYYIGSSTGIIEKAVYDNHEVGDFVLYVFGFLSFHVHHCTARLNVYGTG